MDEQSNMATTILYVDDEELALKYFARAIGTDYTVLTASTADAAIAMLQDPQHRIGVLITDFRMPGRDGGSLLRQIEAEHPHIVRILVTAYADKDVLLNTVNSGDIFRILEKPINMPEVRNTLRMACEHARERFSRHEKLMAIDETLAFLAHELNTPLATIVNFAGGIVSRTNEASLLMKQQSEINKAASAINANAQYCFSILSTFIESVRNADKGSNNLVGNSAHQLISSLLDSYPLTHQQRAMINVNVISDFQVTVLPNCIALVLSSIMSNSLRALSDRSSPMLEFSVSANDCPTITISDNGPGIPPQILERLLVDPITTHSATGGSGMGMFFCKRIMQSFGGSIVVHSIQNERTTVTLRFPTNGHHALRSDQ